MNEKFGSLFGAVLIALALVVTGNLAISGSKGEEQSDHQTGALREARMEGQLWATYALNRHLNPFDIDIDVQGASAILEGEVEDDVQRDLAEQIALSVDGIETVDNRIEVRSRQSSPVAEESADGRDFGEQVRDMTTTASVKSRLLWNRNTAGLAISVSTENGVVRLEGTAESEASRELAEQLAANTDGVERVINEIRVEPKQHARADTSGDIG